MKINFNMASVCGPGYEWRNDNFLDIPKFGNNSMLKIFCGWH